jgi:hypothetical protein
MSDHQGNYPTVNICVDLSNVPAEKMGDAQKSVENLLTAISDLYLAFGGSGIVWKAEGKIVRGRPSNEGDLNDAPETAGPIEH